MKERTESAERVGRVGADSLQVEDMSLARL
jgi:hypothetical protein